jgi:hypothetical protein
MSIFHPDHMQEDYNNFHYGDEDYDDLSLWEEPVQRPTAREPEHPFCVNCKDRRVIPDGKNEWVHEDDYRYMCDSTPKSKSTLSATPRLT